MWKILMNELERKLVLLKDYLNKRKQLIIAYSGGIDSALLLKVAFDELGENVLGVTADSPSVPRREIEEAISIAKDIGARHEIVETEEINNEEYSLNPINRCYFCKSELYTKLLKIAKRENILCIANGTNLDDLGDFRPGLKAADEWQVISPLKDCGITKQDVRSIAKLLKLRIWEKPATPCLASRIPYGSLVTEEKLNRVEQAEDYLKDLNIRELRVRHFNEKARIEINKDDYPLIDSKMKDIQKEFNALGFEEIEVTEFKSGALNEAIKENV